MKDSKTLLKVFLVLFFIQLFCWFRLVEAYDDEITLSSSPYLSIPDATPEECGDWVEDFIIFPVSQEAIVLYLDITFTVSHPYPGDLVVILQYDDDPNHFEILWNMDGSGTTYTRTGIWSFYGLKADVQWKLRLKDCDYIGTGTLVSWTLTMCYHMPPDPPSYVWATAGTGQREVDVYWYKVYDPQCQQYWVEWNRSWNRLVGYDEIEGGVYSRSCDSTSKTVTGLRCVEQYYFRVRTVSIYGAKGRPYYPPAEAMSSYCDSVYVSGELKYVNYDDQYADYYPEIVPLKNVQVTFWDAVTGELLITPLIYTNTDGFFITFLPVVNHPIYLRFHLRDQDMSIAVFDYYNDSLIYTFSDTLGPDSSFYVIKDERSGRPDTIFAKACYSFDYLGRTKYFFQCLPPSPWDTPPVQVLYDYNNVDSLAESGYDTLTGRSQIYITSRGEPDFMYRLTAPIHECAHNIHRKAWNISNLHRPECPSIHYPDSPTSGYCALVEGWAEFLSCVPYSLGGDRKAWYLKYRGQDLEYNDWWSGSDGTNENGSFVEGAVASAWYDMEDLNIDYPDERSGTEYYELGYEFAKIFNIFKSLKPQDMVKFMSYWQNDPNIEGWEKEHLVKIFSQHYIFKPGDANTDGDVTVSDVVFLINYLFKQGAAPDPLWVGDANGDCNVSVSDVIYLKVYLFQSGAEPIYNPDCW